MIKYKQYMSGGIIGTETFNVGNPGNREVKGSLSNKGKVIKGKKSNKITVASGQLRQYAQSVKAKYGMTLDNYVDQAKEEGAQLTINPGKWLINPTDNNEVINNDNKFNLMVQSSNVSVDFKGLQEAQKTFDGIRNGFKETIGQTESNNNYNARNEITNATGKYQFIPRYHKETVENMFGIDWNTFASSPEYQERYMDYWTNKTLIPEAIKLQKKYPDSNLNMSQLMALVHFKGPEGARKELENPHLRETPQEFINGKSINISGNQYINKFKNVKPVNNGLDELKRQSGGITKFQVAGDTKKKDITEIFKPENGTILPVQNNIPQVLLPEQEIKAKEPYWKEKQRQLEEGYLPYKGNKFLEKFMPKRYKSSKNQYEERKQDYIDEEMARTVLKENPYDRNTNANKYMYNLSQAERDILLKSQTWDKTARTYPDKLAQGLFSTFRGFTPNVASNKLGISPYDFNVNTYTRNEGKETGIGTALEGGFGYLAKPLQGVTNAVGITNFNKADNSNYTVKDALQGKQNDAGIIADALTDVTNYAGLTAPKSIAKMVKILSTPENAMRINKIIKPIIPIVGAPLDIVKGITTPLKTELKPISKVLPKPAFKKLREVQSLSSMKLDGNIPEDVLLNKYLKSSLNDDELLLLTGKSRKEIEQDLLSLSSKPKETQLPVEQELASYNGPENILPIRDNGNYNNIINNTINRYNQLPNLDAEYFINTSQLWNNNENIKSIFPNLKADSAFKAGQSIRNLFVDKNQLDEFVSILPKSEEVKSLLPALFKSEGETNEQIMRRMQTAITELKESAPGLYNAASSISSNSAPLYYTLASKLGREEGIEFVLDGYTGLNSMGFLDKAGISKEKILDFMNTHLSTLDFKGKKLPAAYIDNYGQVQVPNLLIKKVGMGTIPLSIFFNSQRNNTDNRNQDIRKYGGQIKYKQYKSKQ